MKAQGPEDETIKNHSVGFIARQPGVRPVGAYR
jgi:hypothetical protein